MEDPVLSAEHTSFHWLRRAEALPLLTYGADGECPFCVGAASAAMGRACRRRLSDMPKIKSIAAEVMAHKRSLLSYSKWLASALSPLLASTH